MARLYYKDTDNLNNIRKHKPLLSNRFYRIGFFVSTSQLLVILTYLIYGEVINAFFQSVF